METLKFKTNIKCGACIATVTPYLDQLQGIERWEVAINDPGKILTVHTTETSLGATVTGTLAKAGYTAERIS